MWRDNPLLQRELIYRLRPSSAHRKTLWVLGILFVLLLVLLYGFSITRVLTFADYEGLLTMTLMLEMIAVVAGAPAAAANAISREREQRTWDLLVITLLHPWEIILGKLIGRVIPLLAIVALGLPLVVGCVVALPQLWLGALLGTLCVLVTLVFFATGSLTASCISRKTVTATIWAYLFAAAWALGTSVLWAITPLFAPSISSREASFWLMLNPIAVLVETIDVYGVYSLPPSPTSDPLSMTSPWVLLIAYPAMTAGLIWLLLTTYRRWAFR